MLDPDAVAEFEAWKEHKLTAEQDLSIRAFNTEMEAQALAYEKGVLDSVNPIDHERINSLIASNPYRKPGMRGERLF